MGQPDKPKKVKPGMRGEKWKLKDGAIVTVLEKLGNKYIEVINDRGLLEARHEDIFEERLP